MESGRGKGGARLHADVNKNSHFKPSLRTHPPFKTLRTAPRLELNHSTSSTEPNRTRTRGRTAAFFFLYFILFFLMLFHASPPECLYICKCSRISPSCRFTLHKQICHRRGSESITKLFVFRGVLVIWLVLMCRVSGDASGAKCLPKYLRTRPPRPRTTRCFLFS